MDNPSPCFCIPLRKGILTIGIVDIIFGALGAGLGVFFIFAVIFTPTTTGGGNGLNNTTITTTTTPTPSPYNSDEGRVIITTNNASSVSTSKYRPSTSMVYTLLVLWVFYCLLLIGFGVILIMGLAREKLMLLKAWLAFRAVGILYTLGTFVAFVFLGDAATIQPSIVDGISCLYGLYCIYVVYILSVEVKMKTSGGLPFPTKPMPFKNNDIEQQLPPSSTA